MCAGERWGHRHGPDGPATVKTTGHFLPLQSCSSFMACTSLWSPPVNLTATLCCPCVVFLSQKSVPPYELDMELTHFQSHAALLPASQRPYTQPSLELGLLDSEGKGQTPGLYQEKKHSRYLPSMSSHRRMKAVPPTSQPAKNSLMSKLKHLVSKLLRFLPRIPDCDH